MKHIKSLLAISLAFCAGGLLFMLTRDGFGVFSQAAANVQKVGITIYPLLLLALWSLAVGLFSEDLRPVTLEYIATTAQRIGLLGTVIGIVSATLQIGANLNTDVTAAVGGALPAVGEALLSTAVGFVIALQCDLISYLRFGREQDEEKEVSS